MVQTATHHLTLREPETRNTELSTSYAKGWGGKKAVELNLLLCCSNPIWHLFPDRLEY